MLTYEMTDATQYATIYADDEHPVGTIQRRRVYESGAKFTVYDKGGKKVGVANTLGALDRVVTRVFGEQG